MPDTQPNESKPPDQRQAVVLSGAGVHGAFEAGVMKGLFSGTSRGTGSPPPEADIFTGSSMGAYNAAVMVSRSGHSNAQSAAFLEKVWIERIAENSQRCGNGVFRFVGDPVDFLDPRCFINRPLTPLRRFRDDAMLLTKSISTALIEIGNNLARPDTNLREQVLNYLDFSGLVTTAPMKRLIGDTVDLPAIQNSARILRITATDWTRGALRVFGNAEMESKRGRNILLGASAIPAIMPRVLIDGKFHHDGGLMANAPLKPAVEAGAGVIHAILSEPRVKGIPPDALENTIEIIARERILAAAAISGREIAEIRQRNRLLAALPHTEALPGGLSSVLEDLTAGQKRQLEIHVYRPPRETPGFFDVMDFREPTVRGLIELGHESAENHNCAESGCVLPDRAG